MFRLLKPRLFSSNSAIGCLLGSIFGFGLGFATLAAAEPPATELPAYQARAIEFPAQASYVRPDGSIYLVGDDGMEPILKKFNELFARTHPGFKFTMLLKGSSTGIGSLTAGVSPFAPMARESWALERRPFLQTFGYQPSSIRIGYAGYARQGHRNPPAFYVNVANPIAGLSVEQAARIFTTGNPKGDATHWHQVGAGDEKSAFGGRLIHPYGRRDDGGLTSNLRMSKMGGFQFAQRYEPLADDAAIVKAVADDPYAIALVGPFDPAALPADVKLVPLSRSEGGPYAVPTYDKVAAGLYPYSPYLQLYINRAPGKPLDPFVEEYARMALSREGQAIIAGERESGDGLVPLSLKEVADELEKLR